MLCPYLLISINELLISINELLISIISFIDINKYGLNVKTAAHRIKGMWTDNTRNAKIKGGQKNNLYYIPLVTSVAVSTRV